MTDDCLLTQKDTLQTGCGHAMRVYSVFVKKCQICGKRASMQLTQIVNGKVTELILCESCAKNKGLFDPQSLSFAEQFFPEEFKKKVEDLVRELAGDKLAALVPNTDNCNDSLTRCPVCDFTLADFRKTGRLGCPDCYNVFAAEISENGGAPADIQENAEESPALRRKKLEQSMQLAIEQEDYETAAKLRDKLKELN